MDEMGLSVGGFPGTAGLPVGNLGQFGTVQPAAKLENNASSGCCSSSNSSIAGLISNHLSNMAGLSSSINGNNIVINNNFINYNNIAGLAAQRAAALAPFTTSLGVAQAQAQISQQLSTAVPLPTVSQRKPAMSAEDKKRKRREKNKEAVSLIFGILVSDVGINCRPENAGSRRRLKRRKCR